jgi:hypothetical protein
MGTQPGLTPGTGSAWAAAYDPNSGGDTVTERSRRAFRLTGRVLCLELKEPGND